MELNNHHDHIFYNRETNVKLFCPQCKRIIFPHALTVNIKCDIERTDKLLVKEPDLFWDVKGTCPCCQSFVNFELIDADIADLIEKFNQNGYITKCCCSGHPDMKIYDAYIIFEDSLPSTNFYDIPSPWRFVDDIIYVDRSKCNWELLNEEEKIDLINSNIKILNDWFDKSLIKDTIDKPTDDLSKVLGLNKKSCNTNPFGWTNAKDDLIRAIQKSTNYDYRTIYDDLHNIGSSMYRMIEDPVVIKEYCFRKGFSILQPNISVGMFAFNHKNSNKKYVIIARNGHAISYYNGTFYDTKECLNKFDQMIAASIKLVIEI